MEILAENPDVKIERYELGAWATNVYVITCQETGKSVLVDMPSYTWSLIKNFRERIPEYILLTHSHIDHISGLKAFKSRLNIPVSVHADDQKWLPFPPERYLEDGDIITFGKLRIKVIHTPGHTPGSVCFQIREHLIAGDTIFPGGPGKTWNKTEFQQIIRSLTEKIFTLPDNTLIYPGHGSRTVLWKEKAEFAIFSSHPHDPRLYGDVVWLS
jgi:hydroxyacylglutathione hydrolase